jgi:hypothetical protein
MDADMQMDADGLPGSYPRESVFIGGVNSCLRFISQAESSGRVLNRRWTRMDADMQMDADGLTGFCPYRLRPYFS